jgi:hypothetical protein
MNKHICTFEQQMLSAANSDSPTQTITTLKPVFCTRIKVLNHIKAKISFNFTELDNTWKFVPVLKKALQH